MFEIMLNLKTDIHLCLPTQQQRMKLTLFQETHLCTIYTIVMLFKLLLEVLTLEHHAKVISSFLYYLLLLSESYDNFKKA